MLQLRDKENRLEKHLREINESPQRPQWKKYDARMVTFPILSEDDVRNICLGQWRLLSTILLSLYSLSGNHQIKQARSYIFEHLKPSVLDDENDEFIIELSAKYRDLVRARFASRHSSSKKYIATVQFDDADYDEPIQGWYCTCSAGARIIGCCAHITALIWHLGVARGEPNSSEHELSANNLLWHVKDCMRYLANATSDDDSHLDDDNDSDTD